jgi:hypothetical protein
MYSFLRNLSNYIVNGYHSGDINLDGKVIAAGQGNDLNPHLYVVFTHPANSSAAANYIVTAQLP